MGLSVFQASPAGQAIGDLLASQAIIGRMEELSRDRKPAIAALDEQLRGRIILDRTERQYVGRWVQKVMASRGWRTAAQRRIAGGTVVTSGMVYERHSPAEPDRFAGVPNDLLPSEERWRRVHEIVRPYLSGYGVDDFIRDKRAEAAEAERRYQERYGDAKLNKHG